MEKAVNFNFHINFIKNHRHQNIYVNVIPLINFCQCWFVIVSMVKFFECFGNVIKITEISLSMKCQEIEVLWEK